MSWRTSWTRSCRRSEGLGERRSSRHGKLDLLRGLFQQGGDIPVGPEVLRYALDVISSDTDLIAAENDEALILIWDHIAELRRLHEERQAAANAAAGASAGRAVACR